jgi:hypothetical protein
MHSSTNLTKSKKIKKNTRTHKHLRFLWFWLECWHLAAYKKKPEHRPAMKTTRPVDGSATPSDQPETLVWDLGLTKLITCLGKRPLKAIGRIVLEFVNYRAKNPRKYIQNMRRICGWRDKQLTNNSGKHERFWLIQVGGTRFLILVSRYIVKWMYHNTCI